jgi:cytochrome c peroxidase
MNNISTKMVTDKIKQLPYYNEIIKIYGIPKNDDDLINYIGDALSYFQRSSIVNPFNSKFDYYMKGQVSFSKDEEKGLELFKGKALCANCHILDLDKKTNKILFTDFTYDNIGVPRNPNNLFYYMPPWINPDGINYIDKGLGGFVNNTLHEGKFKVPTLRNIEVSYPYFHNGSIKTLEEVIHFYNARLIESKWIPEYSKNINVDELGDLKMSLQEEEQLKSFLKTLTDNYKLGNLP